MTTQGFAEGSNSVVDPRTSFTMFTLHRPCYQKNIDATAGVREWFTGQGKSSNEIALEQFAENLGSHFETSCEPSLGFAFSSQSSRLVEADWLISNFLCIAAMTCASVYRPYTALLHASRALWTSEKNL